MLIRKALTRVGKTATRSDYETGRTEIPEGNAAIGLEYPLTFTAPLTRSVDTIAITKAGASTDGYLSSTDYNSFSAATSEDYHTLYWMGA